MAKRKNIPLNYKNYLYSEESCSTVSSINNKCRHCNDCLSRVPYATLIATIMCFIGVGVFCGTMYRGLTLTYLMLDELFHIRLIWMENVKTSCVIIGGSMAALGIMISFIGCLATGATREKVYKVWSARVGGRISCAVLMCITYLLQLTWMILFVCLIIVTLFYTISWALCSSDRVQKGQSIDFQQFNFLFPDYVKQEDLIIGPPYRIKAFCKDYVEKAEVMFVMASFATLLVILSFIHYLICLSANYAHIRDHEKFQELQEIRYLSEQEACLTASKDRF